MPTARPVTGFHSRTYPSASAAARSLPSGLKPTWLAPSLVTVGSVLEVAFSPDGTLLAAAYGDGYVRLWNLVTRHAVGAPLPAYASQVEGATGVAFSPDGNLLASASSDGTVRTWQMPLFADPYAALCADVGPPTKADWTRYAPGEPQPSACR